MSEWLSGMGAAVANHLWQSTAFAVVVWRTTLLLRKNAARVRYGLWVAASVKFLVPFSLLIGLGGMLPRPQHAVVTMPVYSAVDEVGLPFSVEEAMPVASAVTHVSEARHGAPSLAAVLAGVWLCGVVVLMGVWCGGWRKVARTLRRAASADEGREVQILRRVEAAMGGRGHMRLALSREWMEPGMFGIWRPVLIWPEGLSARLDDEHIEAIVAHELMHARRRDNLTAALHMLVEAAFWFHPLVWWMERRMVEERERACDEAVVEMGSRPGVYAESLLKAVRFCVESPLVCVAGVTGADLAGRVRSIMTLRLKKLGLAGKLALGALAFAAIAGPVAFGVVRMIPVYGQVLKAAGPLPSYEVVVIKPSQEGARGASTEGEETHYLMTAKMLIQFAYGIFNPPKVMDLNVVGGPDWIDNDVFSIVGKMDSAEFDQEQKLGRSARHERRQLMEQSLLADRFKLKMHTETRDVPVYALTVIKGGPKMTPAKDVTGSAHVNPNPGSMAPEQLQRGLIVQAKGRNFVMTVKGMTLDFFVDALGEQKETAGKQVVNQTGLTGAYDFTLTWGPGETVAPDSSEVEEPPLFTAIQQQLGLRLADGKGPAELVVIDHIEKPVFDSAVVAATSSAVATAVATGQRLLGSLMPVAFVQEKGQAPTGTANPTRDDTTVTDPAPALHGVYKTWLTQDVRWIITDQEAETFKQLKNNEERDKFIEQFWQKRNPTPGAARNAYREEIYGRIAYANENFASGQPGWMTDRGHVYIVYGKPDEIDTQPGYGTQIWRYSHLPGAGNNVVLKFVDASGKGDYRLAKPMPRPGTVPSSPLAAFDVASIRPSSPAGGEINGAYTYPGGRVECIGCTVQYLVMLAFDVQSWQTSGGPAWIDLMRGDRYDIEAKPPESSPATTLNNPVKKTPPNAEQRQMLQSLLLDRFQLKVHVEKGEGTVYILSRGNKPLKLQPPKDSAGFHWAGSPGGGAIVNGSGIAGKNISMPELAGRLSGFLRRPVSDQTGLAGTYDFEYRTGDEDQDSDKTVGILSSLREIGLNLAPGKGPVDTLVIDHVERPSEN